MAFDTTAFFKQLPAILTLAEAFGVVHTSNGVEIAKIGADIAAVTAGGQPTTDLAVNVETLLNDLHAGGILTGSAMDQSLKVAAVVKNYLSGQIALLDSNFTVLGKPGDVFAIAKDSTNEAAVAFRAAVGL